MPTTVVTDPAFPITYMVLIVWTFFLLYNYSDIWVRITSRIFAFLWSIFILLNSIVGEKWLTINNSVSPPTFTLTTFNDGFGLIMGLTVFFLSLVVLYRAYIALQNGSAN